MKEQDGAKRRAGKASANPQQPSQTRLKTNVRRRDTVAFQKADRIQTFSVSPCPGGKQTTESMLRIKRGWGERAEGGERREAREGQHAERRRQLQHRDHLYSKCGQETTQREQKEHSEKESEFE